MEGGDRLTVNTNALRRSPVPEAPTIGYEATPEGCKAFLTHLSFYDKLMSETTGSNVTDMVKKKKQEDLLKYINSFHSRAVSQMSSGRYTGCWQTRVGEGRDNSRYIRTKTLEEM